METSNAACNAISDYAWSEKVFSKFKLQKAIYYDIKERFELTAQVVVRGLGKVADTYKADKKRKHEFRKRGAVIYDSRILK
ncbi:MAG: RNA-guided endonuclease TnpB family protein, partial [Rhodothermales bacterium]